MNLNELFDSFTIDIIYDYISNSKEENLNLEFKTTTSDDFRHQEDKKNLAKALSGFANSNGGLIIWGIKTRKSNTGIEIADSGKEVNDLRLFVYKLNQLTGEFVNPIVDGIRHKCFETSNNKGFIVTLVPESYIGPHMAKAGENRYFKRSGDSFYQMEHFDIEDMFGRRRKPNLELSYTFVRSGGSQSGSVIIDNYKLVLGIRNAGRGTAKYPYVALNVNPPYELSKYGVDGNCNFGLPKIIKNQRYGEPYVEFGANYESVIHPNTNIEVASVYVNISRNLRLTENIVINYKICSEDFSLYESSLTLTVDEIYDKVRSN